MASIVSTDLIPDQPHGVVSFKNDLGSEIPAGSIVEAGNLSLYIPKSIAAGAEGVGEAQNITAVYHAPLNDGSADDYAVGAKVAFLGGVVVPTGTGSAVEGNYVALPKSGRAGVEAGVINGADGAAAGGDDMIRIAVIGKAGSIA